MPRPLSVTVTKPSASSSTSMKVGVAGERLVHGIVDHLGEEMMQRLLVGSADIHAGSPAHRLQPFEHLDVARRVIGPNPAHTPAGAFLLLGAFARRRFRQVSKQVFSLCPAACFGGDLAHFGFALRRRKPNQIRPLCHGRCLHRGAQSRKTTRPGAHVVVPVAKCNSSQRLLYRRSILRFVVPIVCPQRRGLAYSCTARY